MPRSREPRPDARALLAVVTLVATAAAQGDTGFLAGEGWTHLALSYGRDTIDEYRVGGQSVDLDGELVRESWSLYAVHGWSSDLDLALNATFASNDADRELGVSDESGLQDLFVQARWRAWSEPRGPGELSFLIAPGLSFPLADYETSSLAALGDGSTDLLARCVAQYRFDSGPFLALEGGYDVRFGEPSDEIPLNVTLGHTLFERLTLTPYYSRIESLGGDALVSLGGGGGGGMGGGSGGASFASTQEDYEAVGIGSYWRLNDTLGLSASYRHAIGGSNTGLGDAFSLGVVLGWRAR